MSRARVAAAAVCFTTLLSGCFCAPAPMNPTQEEIARRVFSLGILPSSATVLGCESAKASQKLDHSFDYDYGAYIEACAVRVNPADFLQLIPRSQYYISESTNPGGDAAPMVSRVAAKLPTPMVWSLRSNHNLQIIYADAAHEHSVVLTAYPRCGKTKERYW